MKISRVIIASFIAVVLIAAAGIPTKPQIQVQNGEVEVFMSGRNPMHLLAGSNDYRTMDMQIVEEELPVT